MPLDDEQRKLGAELKAESGWSYSKLAKLFSMSKGSVYREIKPAVDEYGGEEREKGGEADEREREPTLSEAVANTELHWWEKASLKAGLLIALWIAGILIVLLGIS